MDPFGLGTMDQVEPFHDSVSVRISLPVLYAPTPVQADGAEHDTPLRVSDSRLEVSGLGTIDQADPFHISTSVSLYEPSTAYSPTAVHAVELLHETAVRATV